MAKDMYEMVQKKAKPERRWSLRVSTTVALCLIGVVIVLCFHANVQGETIRGKRDNVEKFYSYIVVNGIGRVGRTPEGEPDITIDFGDGGTMEIWETNNGRFHCYVRYEHTDGFSYGYYSSQMTVGTMAVNFLSRRDNAPWNGILD